jgi:hypothetical protein
MIVRVMFNSIQLSILSQCSLNTLSILSQYSLNTLSIHSQYFRKRKPYGFQMLLKFANYMLSGLHQNVMLCCSQWCHNSSLLLTFCIHSFSFHIIKQQNSPTFSSFTYIIRFSKLNLQNIQVLALLLSIYIQILCQSSVLQIIPFIKWNGRPNDKKILISCELWKLKWFNRWENADTINDSSVKLFSHYILINLMDRRLKLY